MKTQSAKRMISVMTALALMLGAMFISAGEAQAASKVKIQPRTLWAGDASYVSVWFSNADQDFYDKAKLISIKSGNKKVIAVKKTGSEIWNHYLKPKKAGKSKITVKYKYKGKTQTVSAVYKVKKYPWPLKEVKVNGKSLNLKKNKYENIRYEYKKTSVTVKYLPSSGWKIVYAGSWMNDYESNKDKNVKIKKSAIKKGVKVKFPKKYDYLDVYVILENKKGETIEHDVRLYRGEAL